MNSDLTTAAPLSLPPHVQLIQMGIGGWVSAVVYYAARMKLADHLAETTGGMNESWGQRNGPYRTLPPGFADDSPHGHSIGPEVTVAISHRTTRLAPG